MSSTTPEACALGERVAAYASGEPDETLAAHLPGCARCQAELDDARAVLRALGAVAPAAASLARADAKGELFWADFSRGVSAQLDADAAHAALSPARARWAWGATGGLVAAAAAVWLWAYAAWPGPGAARPVAPVTADALAAADAQAEAGFEPAWLALDLDADADADADALAFSIDDVEVERVLARLDDAPAPATDEAVELGGDADAAELIEELSDEDLDAAEAAL